MKVILYHKNEIVFTFQWRVAGMLFSLLKQKARFFSNDVLMELIDDEGFVVKSAGGMELIK